jgi:hypothetical protein
MLKMGQFQKKSKGVPQEPTFETPPYFLEREEYFKGIIYTFFKFNILESILLHFYIFYWI